MQAMPNLLSKVIPQAKINLVMPSIRTQSRQGGNQSKSVEPKVSPSPKGGQLHERNKNKDPFQVIAAKYSNINKKKQDESIEKISKPTKSKEISRKQSPPSRRPLENKPFIKSIPVNYIQAFATNENEEYNPRTSATSAKQDILASPGSELAKARLFKNLERSNIFMKENRMSANTEDGSQTRALSSKSKTSPRRTHDAKTKILFYESNNKEEQESCKLKKCYSLKTYPFSIVFHAPSTVERNFTNNNQYQISFLNF